jgi:hypothetical protein
VQSRIIASSLIKNLTLIITIIITDMAKNASKNFEQ